MRIRYGLLFLLLTIPLFLFSQSVKSISETYTYFESDSAVFTYGKEMHRWEYDKQGRILKDDHREGVCFQDWTYDKKGRLLKEESHCGEGFRVCEVEWKKISG